MSPFAAPCSRRRWATAGCMFAMILIAACAAPERSRGIFPLENLWTGRLSLKVHTDPVQAFSADFELRGSAHMGELFFYTPVGTTAAHLQWADGLATLQTAQGAQQFTSLDALTRQVTGAELPVQSVFDWLQGTTSDANDWVVDLSQREQGRLLAVRHTPGLPRVEMRLYMLPR